MQVTMDSNRDFHALILRELRSMRESMDAGFAQVDARFGRVEIRLDNVERRLDKVETRLDGVETRLDGVETRLDGVEGGLESLRFEVRSKFDGVAKLLLQHDADIRNLKRRL